MGEDILSVKDCVKILGNYTKNSSVHYVSHKISPISEYTEGFMGEHYQLQLIYKIHGKADTLNLFVKTKPVKNRFQAETANRLPIYKKEIFLYDYLLKEFEKYGFDTSFAPSSYYCIDNQTLVMDNLHELKFDLHNRNDKFTLEEIKCVLKSLALYHGAGFAYERKKTTELGREFRFDQEYEDIFQETLFRVNMNPDNEKDNRFWKGNFAMMNKLIDLLPKEDNYKNEFKQMIEEAKICSSFVQEFKLPKTCGHGDLWSNNMMFKYNNGIVEKCCLVDFQFIRYNCPSIDVILAIYSNTSAELRSLHLAELFEFYYDSLSVILNNYGYKISEVMSLNDYHESIEIFRHEVLAQVTAINAIIHIPQNVLTDSVKKNDDSLGKIFHDKSDICVEAFKNDEVFNKVMTESLYDLYDALFVKLCK